MTLEGHAKRDAVHMASKADRAARLFAAPTSHRIV